MSWFKRGGERRSPESDGQPDTDPNTCFEVFQNHWKQAWAVISCQDKKATTLTGLATADGVEAVLRNLEQMVTLLVSEDDDGGLPGPILRHVLESELLEKVCAWCTINIMVHDKLRMQQLRLFELIISQSKQMLLTHKPVIKPLLRMLIDVADSHEISNGELEFKLVLVLHQICLCISQQNLILESFFSSDTDHGPARFLIFSLLIPYIHREGPVGQKARDALLLIMTLSSRHPHIGQYIANNSDFCPVLATGLSGLYSSLPRRISPPTDDWHCITLDDCANMPDLQMFLNSLQFSNAVVQVAHPQVRKQLIEFIYSGFLVPVLAPALHQLVTLTNLHALSLTQHQDIPGLPVPLLDTDLFRISREEVMTATAYLDLFIRNVTEPHLLKAVLRFVLQEKHDDVPVLDSLLSRISSNSHLATVTLALFHTLIDLNCEDVMFQLVFRYLVPCTHVMVSQRRSVRDLDLYSKSAEKFLSLRPKCCGSANVSGASPAPPPPHSGGTASQPPRLSVSNISTITGPTLSVMSSLSEASLDQLPWETSYFEYLHDARNRLEQTLQACYHWSLPYDGESPAPDSIASADKMAVVAEVNKVVRSPGLETAPATGYIELGSIRSMGERRVTTSRGSSPHKMTFDIKSIESQSDNPVPHSQETGIIHRNDLDPKLYISLDTVDKFMGYLTELDINVDSDPHQYGQSSDEWMRDLADLLRARSAQDLQGTSKEERSQVWDRSSNSAATPSPNPVVASEKAFSQADGNIPLLGSSPSRESPLVGVSSPEVKTTATPQSSQRPSELLASGDISSVPHGQDDGKDTSSSVPHGQNGKDTSSSVPHGQNGKDTSSSVPHGQENGKDTSSSVPHGQDDGKDTSSSVPHGQNGKDTSSSVPHGQNGKDTSSSVPHGQNGKDTSSSVPHGQNGKDTSSSVPHGQNGKDTSSVLSEVQLGPTATSEAQPASALTSTTRNQERSVPKDLPTALRPSLPAAHSLTTSLFSPTKTAGDMFPLFRSVLSPADEFPATATSSPGLAKLKYLNDPPNIGPFLTAVFARLEGMLSNSLYFNLLLTGVLARLAAYPQPLLRSFLLNHNLVFQPSVKSLIQVLALLRQKLDNFSTAVKMFDSLVLGARHNLVLREGQLYQGSELGMLGPVTSAPPQLQHKPRADSIISALSIKDRKKVTLSDLIFRRSPGRDKMAAGKNRKLTQAGNVQVSDREGSVNNHSISGVQPEGGQHTLTTWNAVYCALVLDEFLKELAALSQEHSVLHSDEGYLSS